MSNEAATSLRSFACWEFHAFSVNEHNASCGRTHELLDEALRTERRTERRMVVDEIRERLDREAVVEFGDGDGFSIDDTHVILDEVGSAEGRGENP